MIRGQQHSVPPIRVQVAKLREYTGNYLAIITQGKQSASMLVSSSFSCFDASEQR